MVLPIYQANDYWKYLQRYTTYEEIRDVFLVVTCLFDIKPLLSTYWKWYHVFFPLKPYMYNEILIHFISYKDLNTRRKARGIEVGWSQPKEKELKEETQWQYIEGKSPKSPNLVRNADDGALLTELRAIQSNFKHLQSDHEQLAGKYDQMTEKYKTTQKEQELLKKQYSDLLVNHKQLQDQYCTLQSQREQFNTKCSALETNIKELDIKYTKLYDEYSKASQDDIRSNQEAVGSPCK